MKNYYVTVIYRESDDENNMKHVYERMLHIQGSLAGAERPAPLLAVG